MADSTHTPELSGRDLARARRREMSRTGAAKVKAGRNNARGATRAAAKAATAQVTPPSAASSPTDQAAAIAAPAEAANVKPLSGAALSRARRAMLAKGGKSALAAATQSPAVATEPSPAVSVAAPAVAEVEPEACCDACADVDSTGPCAGDVVATAENEALDSLCEIIKNSPQEPVEASSSVRVFCRDRRKKLSKKGKLGLPGKAGRQARKSLARGAATSALTGKAMAKLHREDRCAVGRGDNAACRPSGRVRPGSSNAPAKVEIGTTLSGQTVSGTQVEQTEKITGSEAGSCRTITGTEYLGVEQFTNLCSTMPKPAEAKVAISETAHGQLMTGSSIAASDNITGTESGDCKAITGSEYLGVEHFTSVCSSKAVPRSQQKVIAGRTSENMRITGVDEARDNAVTGSESGSAQRVTGSDYVDMQPRSQGADAPAKVGVSHTAAGMSISGGESTRTAGITGDKQDSCGRVTGTEYMSSERFQSTCGMQPEATTAKVGVDSSRNGMTITGNLVDRDNKVTGNEPGTCQRVTGSQYDSSADKDPCSQRSSKVHEMHTLHGRPLTGTEVNHSPKLTGDDRGNCSVVTGTEYISKEGFQESCSQVPDAGAESTGMSQTWNNQLVSGAQTGHSEVTTGDAKGLCHTVTGSSYAGRELTSEFCSASAVAQGEQHLRHNHAVETVSGMAPAVDDRLVGNFQRGRCQHVSGTPYQDREDQDSSLCAQRTAVMHQLARAPSNRGLTQPAVDTKVEVMPYQADFTIMSPAKAAWQQHDRQRVHNSVLGVNSAITGVVNKAQGVISGTPEFRHSQEASVTSVGTTTDLQRERITGEGSEAGIRITGDDWSRGKSITGTEGMFSARRNQTQRGGEFVTPNKIGAHALKDREPMEVSASKVTGGSGSSGTSVTVTLSGGACG